MTIIEQYLAGKHTQDDCEDGIVTTPHFVAVIDGSTSKTHRRFHPTMRNGRYAMMLLTSFIQEMRPDTSLHDFCEGVTERFAEVYRDTTRLDAPSATDKSTTLGPPSATIPPHERLCASAAIYSRTHRQVWLVGDCQCLVDGKGHDNPKPDEAVIADLRAGQFDTCSRDKDDMLDGTTIVHDYARDMILPRLIRSMSHQNKTYAVIDGYPIYEQGIKAIAIGPACSEVVLATDGYPFLCPTLEASEEALAAQLARDPFCIKTFKATKGLMRGNRSFDDRAYVRFLD